jgi:photosystem II stability/assembly factor-like uncharacterized protein
MKITIIILFVIGFLLTSAFSLNDAYAAVDTWTDATTNLGYTLMRGVSMSDASNGVAVGHSGTIVFTTNGGVDWTNATTTNVGSTHMYAVSMSDASNGVAIGASGTIVLTTNGGVDWTNATTTNVGSTSIFGVSMSDASKGVVVGASGTIVLTTNGGVDWTNATTTNVGSTFIRGVSMSDASNGVAVGESGTIVLTTNGGVVWTNATTTNVGSINIWAVSMSDASNGVAVGESGTIVLTTNGGVVWTNATTTNVGSTHMTAVSMSDASNGVAVGALGTIVYTTNGGVVWTDATTTNVGSTAKYAVSMSDASNGVAVGQSGIIFTVTVSSEDTTKKSRNCYDCIPPKLQQAQIQISSDEKIIATDDEPLHITANVGDEIKIILEITDNRSVHLLPTSGIYTNFMERPNNMNLFYANNFDDWGNTSTSFYEWNRNHDDVAYDYADTITWSSPAISYTQFPVTSETRFDLLNDERVIEHFIISFKMKFTDSMKPSQIWVSAADYYGQTFKVPLPLTLEIIPKEIVVLSDAEEIATLDKGDVIITPSEDTTPLLNEPVLFTVLSQWSGYSQVISDDAELLSVIRLQGDSLPAWTKNLGEWVIQEKLDVSELIMAIQYVINQ